MVAFPTLSTVPKVLRAGVHRQGGAGVARGSGIRTLCVGPGPRWKNGYVESFNGKLRDELFDRKVFYTLLVVQALTEQYRQTYNRIRPRSSLGYQPPAPEAILPAEPVQVVVGLTWKLVQPLGQVRLLNDRYTEYNSGPYRWSEMRKLVVLLAIVALVSGVTAVLTGCGSPAPADQPVAAPTETTSPPLKVDGGPQVERRVVDVPAETTSPLLKPTATVSTPLVDDSVPTPTPAPSAGDGIEFVPVDSSGTFKKQEPIGVVDPDSTQKGGPGASGPVQGDPHTWQDGDRAMTVKLQTDLVVEKDSGGLPRDVVPASEGGTNVVRSADGQSKSDTLPVFRSESGALMTLPGGVLLVLSSEWSQAETNAFFSDNGIKIGRVSELDYVANGFFVETGPGFPSLDLANALAVQDGVEISSPNWGREVTPK